MVRAVIDTNVFVASLRSGGGASRQILRRAIEGRIIPLFANTLWFEYEDVLGRPVWTTDANSDDRAQVLAALAAAGRWVKIYYGWRPNLRDAGDDHLIELAVAGRADAIITHNVRDLRGAELSWPNLTILTPAEFLEKYP